MKKGFKKITQILTVGLAVVALAACGAGKEMKKRLANLQITKL